MDHLKWRMGCLQNEFPLQWGYFHPFSTSMIMAGRVIETKTPTLRKIATSNTFLENERHGN